MECLRSSAGVCGLTAEIAPEADCVGVYCTSLIDCVECLCADCNKCNCGGHVIRLEKGCRNAVAPVNGED